MTSSGRKWNLPKVNFLLDFFVFVAFLLAMDPRSTGIPIHEWLSVAWGAAIVTHLVLHWDWTVAVVKRFVRSASGENRLKLVVDIILFIAGIVLMLSGLLISRSALPTLGINIQGAGMQWRMLHTLSADAALLLVGLHLALSWRWIVNMTRRLIARPLFGRKTIPQARDLSAITADPLWAEAFADAALVIAVPAPQPPVRRAA